MQVLNFGGEEGGFLDADGSDALGVGQDDELSDGVNYVRGGYVLQVAFVDVLVGLDCGVEVGEEEDGVGDGPLGDSLHCVVA